MGFVLKIDRHEVEWPLIVDMLIVMFTAVGITMAGIGVLVLASRHMLNTLEDSWAKGKQAVEQQKQSFHRLVLAMYPKFASDGLLAEETHIVMEVPEVRAVFLKSCWIRPPRCPPFSLWLFFLLG